MRCQQREAATPKKGKRLEGLGSIKAHAHTRACAHTHTHTKFHDQCRTVSITVSL